MHDQPGTDRTNCTARTDGTDGTDRTICERGGLGVAAAISGGYVSG